MARPRILALIPIFLLLTTPLATATVLPLVPSKDNTLCEVPGERLTLAYTQEYPDSVEDAFSRLAGSDSEFFMETGSIRSFPGSLTLIKRLLYEERFTIPLFLALVALAGELWLADGRGRRVSGRA